MNKKNILEFCLSPDLGGLELFMLRCYESFNEKTTCKVMVAPNKKLDIFLENQEKYHLKRNKFFPIFPALKLAKFIDEHEIDFIHFHWTRDIATVVLAKVLSKRKPQLMQTRNMTMTRFKDDVYHKWLYKNIDVMHAVTHQVKGQLERFIPKEVRPQIEVVYMGTKIPTINTKRINELKEHYNLENSFVVGIVGRIEESKGQYLLLEAMAKLKTLDIKILIVGHTMDEAYLESLKAKARELGIEKKVVFTGFTKEVAEHMTLLDSMVLATQKETFGLVVIEAMANRVCVIATNEGGPLEIIDDGVDGLLFDRTVEDLASKIELIYEDRALKERLALAGQRKVEEKFLEETQLGKLYGIVQGVA